LKEKLTEKDRRK